MNTDEDGNSTEKRASIDAEPFDEANIEVLTQELTEIQPGHPDFDNKRFEIVDYKGSEARFYPATGAIMVFSEQHNRWIIRANRGGRPDFDGVAMVVARELKREQAIINGLQNAADGFDMRTASDMLARIVEARAKNAVSDEGRTGNADAKFIFSLIGENSEGEQEGPSLRVDMDADTAAGFIEALKEMMDRKEEAE